MNPEPTPWSSPSASGGQDEFLFAMDDAAEKLYMSRRKLERLCRDGEIVRIKLGHRSFISRSSLRDFIARRDQQGRKDAAERRKRKARAA